MELVEEGDGDSAGSSLRSGSEHKPCKERCLQHGWKAKLLYACAAWDPYFQKDIASLEKIQRKAVRFCSNNYHPTASVTEMLQDLGWTSLELTRTMTQVNLL